jgi:hypothetical protein
MGRLCLFLLLSVLVPYHSHACFILFLSDGKQLLVGNHEDWDARDAGVKINPPSHGHYGSVIFTFLSEGWAQGGMNEKGLFFDAAHTPFQEVHFDPGKQPYPGYIWQAVLDKCASVEEAIRFLDGYKLPELSEADIMLADAGGDATIIGVHNGKVAVKRFTRSYLMQTNFNPWHPELSEEPHCWRYEKAEKLLSVDPTASISNMRSILEQTHQDSLTVYSNIYDLRNKTIYTFNKRDFKKAIVIRIPGAFAHGDCALSLDALAADSLSWKTCRPDEARSFVLTGKVVDSRTREPLPYVNIGLFDKNIGTLSDPDGSFELEVPPSLSRDSVVFSSIGFDRRRVGIAELRALTPAAIQLRRSVTFLPEVVVTERKVTPRRARLGWMGGKDGILPFDTIQGGGAVALLVKSPGLACRIEKIQVRLMYSSKDTTKFRLHFYAFDSLRQIPSRELLSKEIMIKDRKRFGWLRLDLSDYDIVLTEKYFLIGFEWIDDRQTRQRMLRGLQDWESWKKDQYAAGNKATVKTRDVNDHLSYAYHGNMMDWPGFKKLPPFTGLMVKKGKDENTVTLRTFERKTSFGQWREIPSTLNAVIAVTY